MSAKHATRGVIFIHPVPPAVWPHAEQAVSSVLGYDVRFERAIRPVLFPMSRTETFWVGDVGASAMLAFVLGGWEHLRFEAIEGETAVSEDGRWSATPGLRILYAQTDLMSSVVVPENRICAAIDQAGGDAYEMRRLLNLALGQAWDDELESFRYAGAGAPARRLHRVG